MSGTWNDVGHPADREFLPNSPHRCAHCHGELDSLKRCATCGTNASTETTSVDTKAPLWFAEDDAIDLRGSQTPTEVLSLDVAAPADAADVIAALARPMTATHTDAAPPTPRPIAAPPGAPLVTPTPAVELSVAPPEPPTLPPAQPPAPPPPPPELLALAASPQQERHPAVFVIAGISVGLVLLVLGVLGSRLVPDSTTQTDAPAATSVLVPPGTITASASSTQDPEGGVTYSAENTLDGRPETAWNSDGRKGGKGPGVVLSYRFAEPVDLTSITVLNGYQKKLTPAGKAPTDLFEANSRVRGLRVVTDVGSYSWELTDDRAAQTLSKDFGTTTSVRFEVLSVYPGSSYQDLALSEVSFTARETP